MAKKPNYGMIQKAAKKLGIDETTTNLFAQKKGVAAPAAAPKQPLDVFTGEKPKELGASSPYTFTPPKPTVATPQQPLLDRNVQPGFTMPDFGDLEGMDSRGLRDYLDAIEVRSLAGEKLTTEELLKGRRAARMLSEMEGQKVNPYTQQISQFGEDIAGQEAAMAARRQAQIDAKRAQLEEQARIAAETARKQGERQQQAVQSTLSFSGFGRSTFAADQANQIQQNVSDTVNAIQRAKDLELAEYQAQLEGADEDVINSLNQQRRDLEQQARQWEIDSITKTDELNRQYGVSFEEKMNNLLQAASQTAKTFEELTDEDKQLISSYATVALDNEGNIDKDVLSNVPAGLMGYVINEAAKLKGGMPGEAAKTVTVGSGKNARVFQWNPQTKQYDIPVGSMGGMGGGMGGAGGIGGGVVGQSISSTGTVYDDLLSVNPGSFKNIDQSKNYGFASNAILANEEIKNSQEYIQGLSGIKWASLNKLPDLIKPDNLKRIEQAQANFVNAVLRQESGAAIPDSEMQKYIKQYFPQPGDSAELIKQKEQNRIIKANALVESSGKSQILKPILNKTVTTNKTEEPVKSAPSSTVQSYFSSLGL